MTMPTTKIVRVFMWRRVMSDSMMFDWIMFCFGICYGIMLMMSHWIMLMVSNRIVLYGVLAKGRRSLVIRKCIWRRERF